MGDLAAAGSLLTQMMREADGLPAPDACSYNTVTLTLTLALTLTLTLTLTQTLTLTPTLTLPLPRRLLVQRGGRRDAEPCPYSLPYPHPTPSPISSPIPSPILSRIPDQVIAAMAHTQPTKAEALLTTMLDTGLAGS